MCRGAESLLSLGASSIVGFPVAPVVKHLPAIRET